ncbi:SdpA family antimicrobial peptide system protein [Mycolicibacterium fluoranthenivorans]|uniref:Antimicrobial peptide system SdpA family protein n=1 Tax=Mycolicibacterium fluoranthenivorans TaxID=258505 RepID=A0A7X5ZB01_9MYCO|nr:SdpA family antimicrobial peptide system protein [Mycolicibacterium fluoranthenivorans]MCV7355218.1 SdpA family antimicrobial peptide system protein [Mycolicibacterium fluoranthenivorans]NIH93911.1 antimicrobial peptide system SdpA family protein [Mycolicibacterium fluoranthenivorans]
MNLGVRLRQRWPALRRRRTMRQTTVVGVVYALVLAGGWLASLAATMPSNIVWNRNQIPAIRAAVNAVASQNFAFFTRSPETDQIDAYRLQSDGHLGVSFLLTPQGKPGNLFGLSRSQRAQGPELASLAKRVWADGWINCEHLDRWRCIEAAQRTPPQALGNDSSVPTVCGDAAITVEDTVKWSYRHLTDEVHTIKKLAVVHVDCGDHTGSAS